jgi:hypothetical protein
MQPSATAPKARIAASLSSQAESLLLDSLTYHKQVSKKNQQNNEAIKIS